MKGRSIVVVIVVAAAAFGLLMFWWARAVGFPRHPEVQAAAKGGPSSAAAVVAGAKKVAAGASTSTSTITSTSTSTSSSAATAAQGASADEKRAILMKAALSIQKQNSERYARALARWGKEKREVRWAQARENALRLALEGDNIQITPDQLECRATLCRLALHPPNPLPNAAKTRGEIGDASAVGSEGTGAARMFILFIPRTGQSLDT